MQGLAVWDHRAQPVGIEGSHARAERADDMLEDGAISLCIKHTPQGCTLELPSYLISSSLYQLPRAGKLA